MSEIQPGHKFCRDCRMNYAKKSTCCTCGHQWTTGEDGSHNCSVAFKATVDKQETQIMRLLRIAERYREELDGSGDEIGAKQLKRQINEIKEP